MSRRTLWDLVSPGTREEMMEIQKELLALDGMYQLAPDALEMATFIVWTDRRTRPTSATEVPK